MNSNETFTREDEVRDNEIDLQGIVNNSHYFVYMMHARHKHLTAIGLDFVQAHKDGYNLLLAEANIKYKTPLRPGDIYVVTSKINKKASSRAFVIIDQEVIRKSDDKVAAKGSMKCTCVNIETGRIGFPQEYKELLGNI